MKKQFKRLQDINAIRNQLAHFGVKFDELGRADRAPILSNARMAHIPSKLKEIEMRPEILYRLVRELEAIGLVLWGHLHPENFGREA